MSRRFFFEKAYVCNTRGVLGEEKGVFVHFAAGVFVKKKHMIVHFAAFLLFEKSVFVHSMASFLFSKLAGLVEPQRTNKRGNRVGMGVLLCGVV